MRTADKQREPARKPRRTDVETPPPRGDEQTPPAMPPSDGRGASRVDESSESTPNSHRPGGRGDTTP